MNKIIYILLLCTVAQITNAQVTNHVILIDNSGSMRGKPANSGNLDIWQATKNSINAYLDQIEIGNSVTLYSFDSYLSKAKTIKYSNQADKETAKRFVNQLTASGGNTCLFTSLRSALQNLKNDNTQYERVIFYVFTDLVQACKDEPYSITDIVDEYDLAKSFDLEHLYYISLAKEVPEYIKNWSEKDSTVTADSKNPNIEEIFPEILLVTSHITIDFSKEREIEAELLLSSKSKIEGKSFQIKLQTDNDSIRLLSEKVAVTNRALSVSFSLDKKYFSNEKSEGKLMLTGFNLKENEVRVTFIMPSKGKITIKID